MIVNCECGGLFATERNEGIACSPEALCHCGNPRQRKPKQSPTSPAPVAAQESEVSERGRKAAEILNLPPSEGEAFVQAADETMKRCGQGIKEEPSGDVKAEETLSSKRQSGEMRRSGDRCGYIGDPPAQTLLKHAATLLRASRYAIKQTAENPNFNHNGYYDSVHKLIAVIENHYDAPPVSKEVSQSDEEIAKGYAAKFMRAWYQDGREEWLVPFIKDAIRRAKEVSESADTARLEALLQKISNVRNEEWSPSHKAKVIFDTIDSAMSAKG